MFPLVSAFYSECTTADLYNAFRSLSISIPLSYCSLFFSLPSLSLSSFHRVSRHWLSPSPWQLRQQRGSGASRSPRRSWEVSMSPPTTHTPPLNPDLLSPSSVPDEEQGWEARSFTVNNNRDLTTGGSHPILYSFRCGFNFIPNRVHSTHLNESLLFE